MGFGWEDASLDRGPLDHLSFFNGIADGFVCTPSSPTVNGILETNIVNIVSPMASTMLLIVGLYRRHPLICPKYFQMYRGG